MLMVVGAGVDADLLLLEPDLPAFVEEVFFFDDEEEDATRFVFSGGAIPLATSARDCPL